MKRLACMLVAVHLCTAGAWAATDGARSNGAPMQEELYRGTRIIGAAVHDASDRKIGEVKDLMLDSARGEVAYAVLAFGKRKLYAVPWRALEPSENGRYYILQADKDAIAEAPGFDNTDWPNTASQRWSEEVDRYWNRVVGDAVQTAAQQSDARSDADTAVTSGDSAKAGSGKAGRGEKR